MPGYRRTCALEESPIEHGRQAQRSPGVGWCPSNPPANDRVSDGCRRTEAIGNGFGLSSHGEKTKRQEMSGAESTCPKRPLRQFRHVRTQAVCPGFSYRVLAQKTENKRRGTQKRTPTWSLRPPSLLYPASAAPRSQLCPSVPIPLRPQTQPTGRAREGTVNRLYFFVFVGHYPARAPTKAKPTTFKVTDTR